MKKGGAVLAALRKRRAHLWVEELGGRSRQISWSGGWSGFTFASSPQTLCAVFALNRSFTVNEEVACVFVSSFS